MSSMIEELYFSYYWILVDSNLNSLTWLINTSKILLLRLGVISCCSVVDVVFIYFLCLWFLSSRLYLLLRFLWRPGINQETDNNSTCPALIPYSIDPSPQVKEKINKQTKSWKCSWRRWKTKDSREKQVRPWLVRLSLFPQRKCVDSSVSMEGKWKCWGAVWTWTST